VGVRSPGVRPIAEGGAHCSAGWVGNSGGGGLAERNVGMTTTTTCSVSAPADKGHDAIAAAKSMRTRTQKRGEMHRSFGPHQPKSDPSGCGATTGMRFKQSMISCSASCQWIRSQPCGLPVLAQMIREAQEFSKPKLKRLTREALLEWFNQSERLWMARTHYHLHGSPISRNGSARISRRAYQLVKLIPYKARVEFTALPENPELAIAMHLAETANERSTAELLWALPHLMGAMPRSDRHCGLVSAKIARRHSTVIPSRTTGPSLR
jgi:hypothetical protein